MADRVFFVAGSPEDFLRGFGVSQQMISDLLEISRVHTADLDQVGAAVENAVGFLDEARLKELVEETIRGEAAADAVVNALRSLRASSIEQTLNELSEWRKADARNLQVFPDEAFAAVRAALSRLIRPSAALDRHRKARRVSNLTGDQAKRIEIVCDARPVFDRERTTVEGFVTHTTLKIAYERQSGEPGCIEVVLAPGLLQELLDKAEKAERKLQVLRESIRSWIPDGLARVVPQDGDGEES